MIERTGGGEGTLGAATRWLELIDQGEFQVALAFRRPLSLRPNEDPRAHSRRERPSRRGVDDVGNSRSRLGRGAIASARGCLTTRRDRI